jgi:hypothetical protein
VDVSIRGQIKKGLRKILGVFGFDIVPRGLVYDWQTGDQPAMRAEVTLPASAHQDLRADHPALQELQKRYQEYRGYPSDEVLLWTSDRVSSEDMLYFRGHNAFVYQEGHFNRNLFGYSLAYYYTKTIDRFNLLETLTEDSAFGAISYIIDNRQVSRDLLDSALEIYFLEDNLGIFSKKNLNVLDIGAGYGRLAHRMVRSLSGMGKYYCTDAVPVSSFICDYYLKFRGINDKALVVPLDRVRQMIQPGSIDLAVNIHSFSECTLPVIQWWLDLLVELEVPSLMIVPNSEKDRLLNIKKQDFGHLIEERGYRLVASQPKYQDTIVQKYALNPDYMYLYNLK